MPSKKAALRSVSAVMLIVGAIKYKAFLANNQPFQVCKYLSILNRGLLRWTRFTRIILRKVFDTAPKLLVFLSSVCCNLFFKVTQFSYRSLYLHFC